MKNRIPFNVCLCVCFSLCARIVFPGYYTNSRYFSALRLKKIGKFLIGSSLPLMCYFFPGIMQFGVLLLF